MKKPISWHKHKLSELVARRKLHHEKVARLKKQIMKLDREIMDYDHDILHAELIGEASFDKYKLRKLRP